MREASEVALITGAVCFAVASNVASSPRVARSAAAGNVGIAWCTVAMWALHGALKLTKGNAAYNPES